MSTSERNSALKKVYWIERDRIAIAQRSDEDLSTDYVSVSEAKTVRVYFTAGEQDFSSQTTGSGVNAVSDYTPTPSDDWQINSGYSNVAQTSSSGSGTGIKVDIDVNSKGNPTFTIRETGTGYAINNTIVFTDPGNTSNTATLTVSAVTSGIGMADKPIIPEEFHDALTYYAIAIGYEMNPQTLQAGAYWRALWQEQISEAKRFANKGRDDSGYHIKQHSY